MWWDMLCVLNLPEGSGQCFTPEEKAKDDEPLSAHGRTMARAEAKAATSTYWSLSVRVRGGTTQGTRSVARPMALRK